MIPNTPEEDAAGLDGTVDKPAPIVPSGPGNAPRPMPVTETNPSPPSFATAGVNDGKITGKEPPLPALKWKLYTDWTRANPILATPTVLERCRAQVVDMCNEIGTVNAAKAIMGTLTFADLNL